MVDGWGVAYCGGKCSANVEGFSSIYFGSWIWMGMAWVWSICIVCIVCCAGGGRLFAASGVTDREIWYYSNKIMFDFCTTNNCCFAQGCVFFPA